MTQVADGVSEGSEQQTATPGGAGEADPQSLVTPEIEQAFEAVFGGGKSGEAGEGAQQQAKPGLTGKMAKPAPTAGQSKRRQQPTTEESEGEDEELKAPAKGSDEQLPKNTLDEEGDGKPKPGSKGQSAQKPTEGQEGQPTLHPVLRHAAKRAGWDDASIDELWESNPEMAMRQFGRLYKSLNDLSAQFAQFGQRNGVQQPTPQQQQQRQGQQAPPIGPGTDGDLLAQVFGEHMPGIEKDYGKDFVQRVLRPLETAVIQPMQEMLAFYTEQARDARLGEANRFFDGIKEHFADQYGPNDPNKRTREQEMARFELARAADQVIYGAASQRVRFTVGEAFERAHLMLQSDNLAEIERKRITSSVVKRSSQITARPTQRRNPADEPQGKSTQMAQKAYTERLAELGIDES